MGAAVIEFFSGLWAAYKARRAAQALADLQRGADILAQAEREAQEMRAAADAMEARKRLDVTLSGVPLVPAAPAPGVAAIAPAEVALVPGSAAAGPDADTARIRKP